MDFNSRVDFYLGCNFYDKNDVHDLVTTEQLNLNLTPKTHKDNFIEVLHRTNNFNKKFKYFFHDHHNHNISTITFVKNRGHNNNNGFILRNINF